MARKRLDGPLGSLIDIFTEVKDPRVARTRLHPLVNILTMSVFGIIGGADGWDVLAEYADAHREFFEEFLDMPHGTPSADTFRRVFEALEPAAFQEAFRSWLDPLLGSLGGSTVAIDGKALRGALSHSQRRSGPFHLLHVWAGKQRLLLAQAAVESAGNEAAAAIELLRGLHLKGATVTADAASCTADVTAAVRERGAHYVLALKGNQPLLHEHVVARFTATPVGDLPSNETTDDSHGRHETRIVRSMLLGKLPEKVNVPWRDLKSIVEVTRVRAEKDDLSVTRSYFITSHPPKSKHLAGIIRGHWGIENELHYILDVSFGEDRRKIRSENGAQNFALVGRHALSLLKRDPTKKSVAMKRRIAAWKPYAALKMLTNGFHAT